MIRIIVFMLALAPMAHAASTASLINTLRTSKDPKARILAATQLGASGDEAAVAPLCQTLKAADPSLEMASAAALGKLAKGSARPCLEAALGPKTPAALVMRLYDALAAIPTAGKVPAPPPPGPGARYYVTLHVANKTSQPDAEIDELVRGEMQRQLLREKGYAVAPAGETTAEAAKLIKARKLNGYFLHATVEPATSRGGKVVQGMKLLVWSYPAMAALPERNPEVVDQTPSVMLRLCAGSAVGDLLALVESQK